MLVGNFQVTWVINLKQEAYFNTTDTEYIVLSTVIQYLLPLCTFVFYVVKCIGLSGELLVVFSFLVFDYNEVCLKLTRMITLQMTP